jgi:hypothetical protein
MLSGKQWRLMMTKFVKLILSDKATGAQVAVGMGQVQDGDAGAAFSSAWVQLHENKKLHEWFLGSRDGPLTLEIDKQHEVADA